MSAVEDMVPAVSDLRSASCELTGSIVDEREGIDAEERARVIVGQYVTCIEVAVVRKGVIDAFVVDISRCSLRPHRQPASKTSFHARRDHASRSSSTERSSSLTPAQQHHHGSFLGRRSLTAVTGRESYARMRMSALLSSRTEAE